MQLLLTARLLVVLTAIANTLCSVCAPGMEVYVYNRPKPLAVLLDGKVDLSPFGLVPQSISINGLEGLVDKDGMLKSKWQDLQCHLGWQDAGSVAAPLHVEGRPIDGTLNKVALS